MTINEQGVAKNFSIKIWLAFIGFAITLLTSSVIGFVSLSGSVTETQIQLAVLQSQMVGLGKQIEIGIKDRYTATQARYVNDGFDRRLLTLEDKIK